MKERKRPGITLVAIIGGIIVALILILGTIWMGRSASKATEDAVRSISLFYLDELAERREQVVSRSLQSYLEDINVAVSLMDQDDLSSEERLQSYQARIKQLYGLEKFAFVGDDGTIYTSQGRQYNIADYPFNYQTISGPVISVKDLDKSDKTVIIAIPINNIQFDGQNLKVCFMEISMSRMLEGISLSSEENETTFCNIYTRNGVALTDMVLGGLASETNLLDALKNAKFESGYSYDEMVRSFQNGEEGAAAFTYNGIQETLFFEPITGTDWMLTYLIRETVINDRVSTITEATVRRSFMQTVLTALVILAMFVILLLLTRRSSKLTLEKETAEAANRAKQEELEQRIALQNQLLEQEKQRTEQDNMISALASDYRSVYYVDLDADHGICYRADLSQKDALKEGAEFPFHETFKKYAENEVDENFREGFLDAVDPENIKKRLKKEPVITYRYLVHRDDREIYEMLRMASVQKPGTQDKDIVHAVGVGFTNVDQETRESLAKNQALSDALQTAEEANKAKTTFLSNMSHEIRTPMNAIIGLDSIALNDEGLSEKTRDHLEKIGSSARHLLNIINDILDMSRIESGRMTLKNEEFSFPKLVEQINTIISGQCQEKGIDYRCQIDGHVEDHYIGDDVKLRQILINILGNAVKFTPEGGSVEFLIKETTKFEGRSTLRFTMKDTGIGMSKEFLPKIFDSFSQEDSSTTNKYGSSGLGLSITKSLVEMMNGQIEVESEKGKGSTFIVTVTLLDAGTSEEGEEDRDLRPQEMEVLVIDDDPVACEHARLVLEKVGVMAETAASGAEAIEMVRLRHARREPYNLILVDWKMPEMDGVETTRRIRDLVGHESAIIILTAYKWDDVQEEAVEAGVDSFIAKPLFASNVLDEFKAAIHKKGLTTSHKSSHKAELKGRRILLAEDIEVNAQIMIMVLQMREMEVEHAENGRIAVDMFAEHPEGYYDAILMDMRMPEMDGLTATRKIREMDREDAKKLPIIALTANAFDEDVQRSLQAGLNAHLSKPVSPEVLFETLESLIPE